MKIGNLVRISKDLYSSKYNEWILEGTIGIILEVTDKILYRYSENKCAYLKVWHNNKSEFIYPFDLEVLKTAEGTK